MSRIVSGNSNMSKTRTPTAASLLSHTDDSFYNIDETLTQIDTILASCERMAKDIRTETNLILDTCRDDTAWRHEPHIADEAGTTLDHPRPIIEGSAIHRLQEIRYSGNVSVLRTAHPNVVAVEKREVGVRSSEREPSDNNSQPQPLSSSTDIAEGSSSQSIGSAGAPGSAGTPAFYTDHNCNSIPLTKTGDFTRTRSLENFDGSACLYHKNIESAATKDLCPALRESFMTSSDLTTTTNDMHSPIQTLFPVHENEGIKTSSTSISPSTSIVRDASLASTGKLRDSLSCGTVNSLNPQLHHEMNVSEGAGLVSVDKDTNAVDKLGLETNRLLAQSSKTGDLSSSLEKVHAPHAHATNNQLDMPSSPSARAELAIVETEKEETSKDKRARDSTSTGASKGSEKSVSRADSSYSVSELLDSVPSEFPDMTRRSIKVFGGVNPLRRISEPQLIVSDAMSSSTSSSTESTEELAGASLRKLYPRSHSDVSVTKIQELMIVSFTCWLLSAQYGCCQHSMAICQHFFSIQLENAGLP